MSTISSETVEVISVGSHIIYTVFFERINVNANSVAGDVIDLGKMSGARIVGYATGSNPQGFPGLGLYIRGPSNQIINRGDTFESLTVTRFNNTGDPHEVGGSAILIFKRP